MLVAGLFICTLAAAYLIFFGLVIWKKEELQLLTFFNEKQFHGDRHKLARAAGRFFILTGILACLLPFSLHFIHVLTGVVFAFVVIGGIAVLIFYYHKWNSA
ncbi:hypothetical protein ABNN70_04835 [Sporolactobacillus sp. Y61]|uniref:DUF3784 domain-containing protein n=1 Tax=Sporolactobacillus sp. Y61 TaxID=3160863 RepID=A0AAU8IHV6_9BACL